MKDDLIGISLIILILFISYKIYSESDYFNLKCIISTVDGEKYCVRDRKNIKEASDLLANLVIKMNKLIEYLKNKYPEKEIVKNLIKNYNPKRIVEILPNSQYTAYSENKGRKIAFCLNEEKENDNNLIDENTLMFVALHELSHLATKSIGHKDDFWKNFKFLIKEASENNLYRLENYKIKSKNYCGVKIKSNPYYDI
jgi:predicted metal-dependent hydrolase|tara:strand:+ start:904 stop:1497 length:594 start_codon:yes stop_codon:yes gene_type:complete